MAKEWYVLRVASGREESVKEGLLKKIQLAGLQDTEADVFVRPETFLLVELNAKALSLYSPFIVSLHDLLVGSSAVNWI